MRSYLEFEGMYDKSKRYIVQNWSDEDFTQEFGAESTYNDTNTIEINPVHCITIKAGEMRELGQFEALTITKHFVDREMFKEAAKLGVRQEIERAEMGVNNPERRKPFEDKTIQEIKDGVVTPFMDKIREEIRKEELAKIKQEDKEEVIEPVKVIKEEVKEKVSEFAE